MQAPSSGLETQRPAVRPGRPSPPPHFVGSGEAGPGLVGPAVIVLSVGHLHVVAEADKDLPFPKLLHCGPLAELQGRERHGRSQPAMF